ncbi:hypothetical protein ACFVY4_19225 [Streptomyces sp. NPDC058299]|uniref:hypothetical protein n=1 Tax=Streptomyces sp. NPDC058299 TaxID=3346435 RepID=UPI0036DFAFF4
MRPSTEAYGARCRSVASWVLGTLIVVRPARWLALIGSWAAGWWVLFSSLRQMRDGHTHPRARAGVRHR